MKYLIDGITKQVTSLAGIIEFLRPEDEFRVYESSITTPEAEGWDINELNSFILKDSEIKIEIADTPTRGFKLATDFEEAIDWCDCYVTFESEHFILANCSDIEQSNAKLEGIVSRLNVAKSKNKKVFLGNRFSSEFYDCMMTYENIENNIIGKTELEEMLEYRGTTFEISANELQAQITLLVGTNSCSGKFSSALRAKKMYEAEGERVCVICSEESSYFIDNSSGEIYNFCRNYSDLTTDEDFCYIQGLICKITNEKNPDRIIIVTQAGVGVHGVMCSSQNTPNGQKMKGLWNNCLEQALGYDSLIICANSNRLLELEKLIMYYNIQKSQIDMIFISPIIFGGGLVALTCTENFTYYAAEKEDSNNLLSLLLGLAIKLPMLRLICNYDDIGLKVESLKKEDYFISSVANNLALDILHTTTSVFSMETNDYILENLDGLVHSYEESVTPELFEKASNAINHALQKLSFFSQQKL